MAETSTASDSAEHLKATAAFFSNVFNPAFSPLVKAQTDFLATTETVFSDWLRRRHDAATDIQQLVARLCTISSPLEALKTQQEWVSRAFLRLAADTAAYQSVAGELVDRARTWIPQGAGVAESVDEKGAQSIQDVTGTKRASSESAQSALPRAAAAAAMRPMRVAEKTG